LKIIFFIENILLFLRQTNKIKIMFEQQFKEQMKRLHLKRYDVCAILRCTMPTLKSRLQNPQTFTIGEVHLLQSNSFDMSGINVTLNI
jgi:hypothetical protein